MVFAAGKSGNPSGRPKGSRNVRAVAAQTAIIRLLDDVSIDLKKHLQKVIDEDPKEGIKLFVALAEFGVPKLSRLEVDLEADVDHTHRLSDEDKNILQSLGVKVIDA